MIFNKNNDYPILIEYPNFHLPILLMFNIGAIEGLKNDNSYINTYIELYKKNNCFNSKKDISYCINELIDNGDSAQKIFSISNNLYSLFKNNIILINIDSINIDINKYLKSCISHVVDKCYFIHDFWQNADFYFSSPLIYNKEFLDKKYNNIINGFIIKFKDDLSILISNDYGLYTEIECIFNETLKEFDLKKSDAMQMIRFIISAKPIGYNIFKIIDLIGINETIERINYFIKINNHE